MGGEFLPDFNEGTITIGATATPGTSLQESNRLAARAEKMLMEIPEVTHVSRRTGRAELDEHAENVNFSEIDVGLQESKKPLPGWQYSILRAVPGLHGYGVKQVGRPHEVVLDDIRVKLGCVATVERRQGPNTINRENVVRRIVVQANTAGRDLVSVVEDIQAAVAANVTPTLPEGYFIAYGGQFEAQREANFRLLVLGTFSLAGIFLLLFKCLNSWRAALQVMINIPLAAIGAIVALLIADWPRHGGFSGCGYRELAGHLACGRQPVRCTLGRLHHADRHRVPQRYHDDIPLYPSDEI